MTIGPAFARSDVRKYVVMSNVSEATLQPAAHRLQDQPTAADAAMQTAFPILAMLSVCHFLNDMIQSLLPAIYPLLKDSFALDFWSTGERDIALRQPRHQVADGLEGVRLVRFKEYYYKLD